MIVRGAQLVPHGLKVHLVEIAVEAGNEAQAQLSESFGFLKFVSASGMIFSIFGEGYVGGYIRFSLRCSSPLRSVSKM